MIEIIWYLATIIVYWFGMLTFLQWWIGISNLVLKILIIIQPLLKMP